MPTYSISGPDGRIYSIEGPEGATREQVISAIQARLAEQPVETVAPAPIQPKESTIGGEFKRGISSLISGARTGAGAIFGSPEEAAVAGLERAREISEAAGEGPSLERVGRVYEQRGLLPAAGQVVSDVPKFLAQQAPQIGTALVGSRLGAMAGSAFGPPGMLVGGALGAAVALAPSIFGQSIERQAQEQIEAGQPVDISTGRAAAATAGSVALEATGLGLTLGKTAVKSLLGVTDDAALLAAKNQQRLAQAAEATLLGTAARGVGRGVVVEMPVEVAQSVLERWQAGLDVTSPEALQEYGEAMYAAGLVGGPLGAVGSIQSRREAQQLTLAPGQEPGESLYDTATRLNAQIQTLDQLIKQADVEATKSQIGVMSGTDLIDMYRTQGYGAVKQYQVSLEEKAQDTELSKEQRQEASKAAKDVGSLLEQVTAEEVARKFFSTPNIINNRDVDNLGFSRDDPVRQKLLNKDINNPDQAAEIISVLEGEKKGADPVRLETINTALETINGYLGSAFYGAIQQPSREGVSVAGVPGGRPAAARPPALEPTGVVRPETDVRGVVGREAGEPAPVTPVTAPQSLAQVGDAGTAIVANMYQAMLDAHQQGKTVVGGIPDPVLIAAAKDGRQFKNIDEIKVYAQQPSVLNRVKTIARGMQIQNLINAGQTIPDIQKKFPKIDVPKTLAKLQQELTQKTPSAAIKPSLRLETPPEGVPQNIWNLHTRLNTIDRQLSGDLPMPVKPDGNSMNPSDLRGVSKRLFRLYNTAVKNLVGEEQSLPFMQRLNVISGVREAVASDDQQALDFYKITAPEVYEKETKRSITPELEARAGEILKAKEAEAKEAKEAAPEVTPKTEKEAQIAQRQVLVTQLEGVLKRILAKYGLKDVKFNLKEALSTDPEGEYQRQVITLALNVDNPVRVLRHESIHALKDMGFFSDAQWKTLTKRANDEWIGVLKATPHSETQSRYDAYIDLFTQEGKAKGLSGESLTSYVNEAVIEEAIADAFGGYDATKAPPGLMSAILNRMRNLFKAIKEAFNLSGIETAEEIFGKIEKGKLKPAVSAAKEAAPKPSLRSVPLSTRFLMESNPIFAMNELGLKTEGEKKPGGILLFNDVRSIANALNRDTINNYGSIPAEDTTANARNLIANAIANEVAYQVGTTAKTGTGLGWYSNNYPKAVRRLAQKFPELATNPHARSVFSALVAVTSNGEKVALNIKNAIGLYETLREGKPLIAPGSRRATALENNLQIIQDLLAEHKTNFKNVLLREILVKDMNAALRARGEEPSGDYLVSTKVPAAAIYFGPKLGAFYANLEGAEGYLTMDLWWTRSLNRMRGLLIPKPTESSINRFREFAGDPNMTREEVINASVPIRNRYEELGWTTDLEHMVGAKEPAKKLEKPRWVSKAKRRAGAAYDQLKLEHDVMKMANTIYKNQYEMLEEAPFGANDREFMYRAAREAQKLLKQDGIDLSLADIQAALWYYEKRLYQHLSGRQADDIGYDEAISAVARESDRPARPSVVFGVGVDSGAISGASLEDSERVRREPAEGEGVTDEAIQPRKPAIRPSPRGRERIEETVPGRRPEPARDRGRRDQGRSLAPLAGAPDVSGATGPDPRLVEVAESYADKYGIPYSRQEVYVELDEDRARRIAQAYEDMVHAPQDPKVKEAYRDLIEQTRNQYDALIDAGYTFTFFDSNTDPYGGNPFNAMRDLRQNKTMAVYGTYDGYGTEGITGAAVEDNPMLEDTGLRWPDQDGVEHMVTANDLFRAVHDAFGHGLEGAGFRARGEENAWQAHIRLFTGPAVGAITSETRGQNSWLNYGPYGDKNRTAKLEDTVFAEQKTGLMPEWTWKDGAEESKPPTKASLRGVVLGTKQPDAQSYTGTHYGNAKVDTLLGSKYGSGIRGAERRRLETTDDDRIKRRVYFYVPNTDGSIPLPEAGLGQYVYTQKFDNILGPSKEMSRLFNESMGDANTFESLIVDAGYDGYAVPNMGMMVILNHDAPVEYKGTRAELAEKKSLRASTQNSLFARRMQNIDIKSTNDFWKRIQNIMIGTGSRNPALSAILDTRSTSDQVKQAISVWKQDVEKSGIKKYLQRFLISTGVPEMDDIIGAKIIKNMLVEAGIRPTLANAIAAYESLPTVSTQEGVKPEKLSLRSRWSDDRIDSLVRQYGYTISGRENDAKAYAAFIRPQEFLNATASKPMQEMLREEIGTLDVERLAAQSPMHLVIKPLPDGRYQIADHEGRHRMMMLSDAGYTGGIPVVLQYGYDSTVKNATDLNNIILRGQRNGRVYLKNISIDKAIPISWNNRNAIKETFGGEADVKFSLRSLVSNAMTPQVTATVNKIAPPRYDPTLWERILNAVSGDSFTKLRSQIINRYEILAKYDRRVAEQIRQSGGVQQLADQKAESAALFSDLTAGLLASALGANDKFGGAPVFRNGVTVISNQNGTVKGPVLIFKPLADLKSPEVFRLWQTYVAVKRGVRLDALGKEHLIDQADVQAMKSMAQNNPQLIALFESVRQDWIKYNDALVKYMQDTGVITPKMAKEWTRHGDYFPFYRLAEEDVVGPRGFRSIANVTPPKALKGGENPLGDFFENVVRNSQAAIQAGIKNVAAQRATAQGLKLKEVVRLPRKSTGVNVYRVLENGQEVYYESADPLFIDAIKSLNMPDLPFLGLLAGPANLLRNLVTKDPAFMLANMMRDSLSAYTTSGVKMTPFVDTIKNFGKAIANRSPETRDLYAAGVLGGYDYSKGVKTSAREFEQRLREVSGTKTPTEKLLTPITSLWGALEKGTQASDAATRAEVYKRVLAETGNEAEAYWQALEVMNFNRRGNSPVVRVLTAAIPFLNARMQGLDLLYRTAIFPLGGTASEAAKQRMKTFWVRGMTLMSLSMMYWALTHDDEEYKKQEQETRDNYWLFPSLGIKIPIPFEVGVMFKVIPERLAALTLGDDTYKDFTKSMVRQLTSTFGINLIPQAALPIAEVTTNYSFFTGRSIIGKGLEDVAPQYQISPGTSRVAEMIGQSLGMSPIKLDHLLKGYTGSLGMYASDLFDMVFDMNSDAPKASKRFEQMPIIKRFAVDPEARGTVTAYYELKDSVDEVVRTSNLLERSMNYKDYGQYMTDNIRMLATKDYINALERNMKEFREMKLAIRTSGMSAEAKRDALTSIGRMESQLTQNIQTLKKNAQ